MAAIPTLFIAKHMRPLVRHAGQPVKLERIHQQLGRAADDWGLVKPQELQGGSPALQSTLLPERASSARLAAYGTWSFEALQVGGLK